MHLFISLLHFLWQKYIQSHSLNPFDFVLASICTNTTSFGLQCLYPHKYFLIGGRLTFSAYIRKGMFQTNLNGCWIHLQV